jgi:hypothetical protein
MSKLPTYPRKAATDRYSEAERAWVNGDVACGGEAEQGDPVGWIIWNHNLGILFGLKSADKATREQRIAAIEEERTVKAST